MFEIEYKNQPKVFYAWFWLVESWIKFAFYFSYTNIIYMQQGQEYLIHISFYSIQRRE